MADVHRVGEEAGWLPRVTRDEMGVNVQGARGYWVCISFSIVIIGRKVFVMKHRIEQDSFFEARISCLVFSWFCLAANMRQAVIVLQLGPFSLSCPVT